MKKINLYIYASLVSVLLLSCGSNKSSKGNSVASVTTNTTIAVPDFNADSAYHYVAQQVEFGPRVPNTSEHDKCADFLVEKLKGFGAKVYRQDFDAIAFDGTILKSSNIIGAYKPESNKRIALFAHWDTRPWADNDKEASNRKKPVLGANDGASGVGVLLEIARNIQLVEPTLGIDIILFDSEDYGAHQDYTGRQPSDENNWCLGSQYWSRVPHVPNYRARFGILLDMVGAKEATFYYEGYSKHYAKNILEKVWNQGIQLGYGNNFIKRDGGAIIDDHLYVNAIANIRTIDIIPFYPNNRDSSFGSRWHTVNDDMSGIDRTTLKAVGQTVMTTIYNEQ